MKQRPLIFVFLIIVSLHAAAQDNIGLKYIGISIHPRGERENAFLMPLKFDKYGYVVLNYGAMASYETFFYKDIFSVKAAVGLYSDCAARLGGFWHIGLRGRIFKAGKHSLFTGIGPTHIFRKNWAHLDGYINPNYFNGCEEDNWQYIFMWYGCEIEYKYILSEKWDFAVTLFPGYPSLINFSFGVSYKFLKNKDVNTNK